MRLGSDILAAVALAVLACGCVAPRQATEAEIRLPAPPAGPERACLGLSGESASFRLEEIRCELLVVDCFDMYCHICQTGAERVNCLHKLIQERGLGNRVKVVGLGVGDTALEVAAYRDKFRVPFPLFSDRRAAVARSLGPLRLPNLIVLRKQGHRLAPIYASQGELRDPENFVPRLEACLKGTIPPEWKTRSRVSEPVCDPGSATCRLPVVTGSADGAVSKYAAFE